MIMTITCRVGDEQPVSGCGIVGRTAVMFVGIGRDVASCQLNAWHHDEDVSTTLGADRPLTVDVCRVLARPVGTSKESSTNDFTVRRLILNPATQTRSTFTHTHTHTEPWHLATQMRTKKVRGLEPPLVGHLFKFSAALTMTLNNP